MFDFRISADWQNSDDSNELFRASTANLSIYLNNTYLTQNINGWTKSVQDTVLVSTYPLAQWFAAHWWRLENELLILNDRKPDFSWREAHELGAADHGYVWPKVLFVSDGEFINIWSDIVPTPMQSVSYVGKLDALQAIPIEYFQREVKKLIEETIHRTCSIDQELPELWKITCEDICNPEAQNIRRLEALLGYDPEECPEEILTRIIDLQKRAGKLSVKELAPVLKTNKPLQECLQNARRITFQPQISGNELGNVISYNVFPWQQGVGMARQLREKYGLGEKPVTNKQLLDLLGMPANGFSEYNSLAVNIPVSVGENTSKKKWQLIPRAKYSEEAQRFELSRLLGDAISERSNGEEWLVAADNKSYRQKMQRAFAAEFLCPFPVLDEYLNDDYSETKQEQAAKYFQVSPKTIETLLMNNGRIEREYSAFPYSA